MMLTLKNWMINLWKTGKKGKLDQSFPHIEKRLVMGRKTFSRGQAWIDLLLLAKFRDGSFYQPERKSGRRKKGHVYRSISSLADRWGWSRKKVDHFLIS